QAVARVEGARLHGGMTGHGVTAVAMEATGVYWKPVWAVLAGDFELVLANAHHVKAVPGRKTDVNDATWLADLLAHGLPQSQGTGPSCCLPGGLGPARGVKSNDNR